MYLKQNPQSTIKVFGRGTFIKVLIKHFTRHVSPSVNGKIKYKYSYHIFESGKKNLMFLKDKVF